MPDALRGSRWQAKCYAQRPLRSRCAARAALAAAAGAEADVALAAPSAAEVCRVRRLYRRSKRELAAMVIRLEREADVLHRHIANLREHLLRNGLGRGGRVETEPAEAGPLT